MQSHFLALEKACAQLTKVAGAQAAADVHGAQAQALLLLSERETCRISELGHALNLGKPATTILVRRMEKTGLICRAPNTEDARAISIGLTPSGRDALGKVGQMIARIDQALLCGFSPRETEIIETYLRRAARIDTL